MTRHTPEPWYAERTAGECPIIVQGAARPVAVARLTGRTRDPDADARRIVACVNACSCFATEALEASALDRAFIALGTILLRLQGAQDKAPETARDDLAAACRLAKEAVRALGPKENPRAPGPDRRPT